jgi:hypothetical protein
VDAFRTWSEEPANIPILAKRRVVEFILRLLKDPEK